MTHTIRIVPTTGTPGTPGDLGDLSSQLSGMAAQVSSLATAGAGLPGLNALGSQISSLVSEMMAMIPPQGNASGVDLLNQISGIGSQISTGGMTGMAGLSASLSSLTSQLQGVLNPQGLTQAIHKHVLDALQGITHSAFQNGHSTTWSSSGITNQSTAMIQHVAPQIPHIGNLIGSDTAVFTKGVTALGFTTSSDARLKSDVRDYNPTVESFLAASVRTFFKRHIHTTIGDDGKVKSTVGLDEGTASFGFIAQEIRELFPELVGESHGFLTVDEGKLGFIIWSVLQGFIRSTNEETSTLRDELEALKEEVRKLKNG